MDVRRRRGRRIDDSEEGGSRGKRERREKERRWRKRFMRGKVRGLSLRDLFRGFRKGVLVIVERNEGDVDGAV